MKKETIFDKVDYKLLAKQKMLLIELNNSTNIEGLDGLIYFLDAFQDEAVDMHGKSETEVFVLEETPEQAAESKYGLSDSYSKNRIGFIEGAKWYRDKIKGGKDE